MNFGNKCLKLVQKEKRTLERTLPKYNDMSDKIQVRSESDEPSSIIFSGAVAFAIAVVLSSFCAWQVLPIQQSSTKKHTIRNIGRIMPHQLFTS